MGQVLGGAHGVLGDVGPQAPQPQVIGAVEHAAVGVATAIVEVAVSLGGGHIHHRAVKPLADEGLRGLGAEVAQKHHQSVDPGPLHVVHGGPGVQLGLHSDGALIHALPIGGHQGGPTALGQRGGETGAGHGD